MVRLTDREVVDQATLATEQIGRTRFRTPEGFLYCVGARLARTGPMLYAQAELPGIEPGPHTSLITVLREEDVLFDPDCIASFVGKSVTNDHPNGLVSPLTYREVDVGTALNLRRGEGAEANYLLADLLIKDQQLIEDIENGLVELSPGYDAELEQIKPGVARQTKIVGNHVAFVKRARGGPSCAIQDSQAEEPEMATKTTRRILDGIRKAFKTKDEAALEEQLGKAEDIMDEDEGEGGDGKTIVIKVEAAAPAAEAPVGDSTEAGSGSDDPYEPRFKAIEDALGGITAALEGMKPKDPEPVTDEASDETKEEEKEATKAEVQDTMSKAEILAPGVRVPTMDAAASQKRSVVTTLRRTALKTAFADSARKVHVEAVLGGRTIDFDKAPPSQVAVIFDAASAVARASVNASVGVRPFDVPQGRMTPEKMQTLIQERRKASA